MSSNGPVPKAVAPGGMGMVSRSAAGGQRVQRVLGIDPGTRLTGFGIVEGDGHRLSLVASGTIVLTSSKLLSQRLVKIHDQLMQLINEYKPDVVAVEDLFLHKNAMSALKLGHARGVILLSAASAGLDVYPYPPTVVKQYVTGYGRAEKGQVSEMVRFLLSMGRDPKPDEGDALAIAICHLFQQRDGFLPGDLT